jgi:hypothetical protein
VNNISAYMNLYYRDSTMDPVPHLLIVIDDGDVIALRRKLTRQGRSDLAAACGGAYLEQNWENTAEIVKCELPVPAVIALLGAGDCDRLLEHLK